MKIESLTIIFLFSFASNMLHGQYVPIVEEGKFWIYLNHKASVSGYCNFIANQLSKRSGQLICEFNNGRCLIGGKVKLYINGRN